MSRIKIEVLIQSRETVRGIKSTLLKNPKQTSIIVLSFLKFEKRENCVYQQSSNSYQKSVIANAIKFFLKLHLLQTDMWIF